MSKKHMVISLCLAVVLIIMLAPDSYARKARHDVRTWIYINETEGHGWEPRVSVRYDYGGGTLITIPVLGFGIVLPFQILIIQGSNVSSSDEYSVGSSSRFIVKKRETDGVKSGKNRRFIGPRSR